MTRVRDLLSVKVPRATPKRCPWIFRLVICGKEEFFGASSLMCICHISTLSLLLFLHLLGTKKEATRPWGYACHVMVFARFK